MRARSTQGKPRTWDKPWRLVDHQRFNLALITINQKRVVVPCVSSIASIQLSRLPRFEHIVPNYVSTDILPMVAVPRMCMKHKELRRHHACQRIVWSNDRKRFF